ncbi:MAG TPA: hypothetical protein VGE09_08365 [Pseudoxanthomonas sp.]
MIAEIAIDPSKARKAYGSFKAWARRLNVPYTTVIGWRDAGEVPHWRFDRVADAARQDGKDIFVKAKKVSPKKRRAA